MGGQIVRSNSRHDQKFALKIRLTTIERGPVTKVTLRALSIDFPCHTRRLQLYPIDACALCARGHHW